MGINEYIKIGSRIKKLRMNKGVSQREVAKQLNIPVSTYSNYENDNREPSMRTLRDIAECLGGSVDDLLGPSEREIIENYSKSAHTNELLFNIELSNFSEEHQMKLLDALDRTIKYVNKVENNKDAIERLTYIISAYGQMIITSLKLRLETKNQQSDYLAFLQHYDHCIEMLNTHKREMLDATLAFRDGDSNLHELIYGKDGKR